MSASPANLTDHLGFWLRFVSNHVSDAFARKLEHMDVSVAEWVVLREIYGSNAMAPSLLADRLGMTRGGITKLVDRLIAKSLVLRRASEEDGRAQVLLLTSAGNRLVPRLAALADQNETEFFAHMTRDERSTLERLLREIVRHGDFKTVPVG